MFSFNMFYRKPGIDWIAFWSCTLAFIVYLNSFKAGFVYDDNRAILSNLDVLPETPWTSIIRNDFWGSPLTHSGSHKSFRPLTTLSFRLNYYFSGFNPWSYHVTNVVLHVLTTWLFVLVARIIFRAHKSGNNGSIRSRRIAVMISSLLFACHPIHTEAVTSIVGRAEVGSTGFSLAAFLAYVNHVKYRDKQQQQQQKKKHQQQHRNCSQHHHHHHHHHNHEAHNNMTHKSPVVAKFPCKSSRHEQQQHQNSVQTTSSSNMTSASVVTNSLTSTIPGPGLLLLHRKLYFASFMYLTISIILAAAAMFTKEQGITIILICATYDLIRSIIRVRKYQIKPTLRELECSASIIILAISFLALFHFRISLMGGFEPPKFAKADNPTAHNPSLFVRLATFLFLPVLNVFLLLHPRCLSYDWSMEAIPRVQELGDPRNLITVVFYFLLLRRIISSFRLVNKSMDHLENSEEGGGGGRINLSAHHHHQQHHPLSGLPVRNVCYVCRFSSTNHKCYNNNSIISTPSGGLDDHCSCNSASGSSGGCGSCISCCCCCCASGSNSSGNSLNNGPVRNNSFNGIHHHQSQLRCWQKQAKTYGGSCGTSCTAAGCGYGGATGGHFKFASMNNKLSNTLGKTFRRQSPSFSDQSESLSSSSNSSRYSNNNNNNNSSSSSNNCGNLLSIKTEHGTLLLELAFVIWPFIPATNLFFYVGFVIAERVLYFPSVGFCLLLGHGFLRLWLRAERGQKNCGSAGGGGDGGRRLKQVIVTSALVTLLCLCVRTVRRNEDWQDEEELYSSGININPPKSWGNLGNVLHDKGRVAEAEVAYRQALRFRPNMADVHYNLGLVLEGQGRLDEALTSYRSAIHFRPLLAAAYLNAAQVLLRKRKTEEAMALYEKCFKLPDDGVKDLRLHIEAKVSALLRYGKLLVEEDDDPRRAIGIYRQAVKLMPPHFSQAQSVYNALGEALSRIGEASQAEEYFKEALRRNPDHIPAHLTYGKMLARNKTRLLEAESWFRRAKRIAPSDARVYHHYGQFLASQGRNSEAAESYVMADALTPNDYEIVVGAANGLRQAGDNLMAEVYYEKAVALRPQEARAHMNLGAIRHLNRKYSEAHESYLTALKLKPDDQMTLENLKKLCQLQGRTKVLFSCNSNIINDIILSHQNSNNNKKGNNEKKISSVK